MRRLPLTLLLPALLLAGCGSASDSTPAPATATPMPATLWPVAVKFLYLEAPRLRTVSSGQLHKAVYSICIEFQLNKTLDQITARYTNSGLTPVETRALIGFAVDTTCTEYRDRL